MEDIEKLIGAQRSLVSNNYFNKFLNTVTNQIIIEYRSRSGGNLVQRIIASDSKNIYWDKFINNSTEDTIDPIYWPINGFRPQIPHTISPKDQQLHTCHTGGSLMHMGDREELTSLLSLVKKAEKVNKRLIIRSHNKLRKYNKNMTIVRVIGNKKQLGRNLQSLKEFFEPVNEPNTHNININKLVSEDYELFLCEYTNLCKFLNINMNTHKVRKFIEEWVARQ